MRLNLDIELLRDIFKASGYELYLVGGCVRDTLMGIEPHDWDMCTNAEPDEIVMVLKANDISFHTVGLKFGTITAQLSSFDYEITTFRKETGYSDSRHPDKIEWAKNIEEDLARRDFTINAIAYNLLTDEYVDPYGGIDDIKAEVLKSVGRAHERFGEDALRILRGIRFAVKYNLCITNDVALNMHYYVEDLDNISKERITDELLKILACNKPVSELFLRFSDIICKVIPEMEKCLGIHHNNKYHQHTIYEHILAVVDLCNTDDVIIKLAALLHDIGKPDCKVTGEDGWSHYYGHDEVSYNITKEILKKDLVLTSEQSERLLNLVHYHDMVIESTHKSMRRALNKFGESFIRDWFVLKKADQDDHVIPEGCRDYRMNILNLVYILNDIILDEECFKLKDMKINGKDVMEILNIKPSKQVGEVLDKVFNEVIDGVVENKRDVLINRVKELYRE